jgi:hypothetical protein
MRNMRCQKTSAAYFCRRERKETQRNKFESLRFSAALCALCSKDFSCLNQNRVAISGTAEMSKAETQALLVLAPGAFVRADLFCPHCRRTMRPEPRWRVKGAVIDWIHVCDRCDSVLERPNSFVQRFSSLQPL